jgi:putative Mg2+ transporter-C (MgtC) family protein
MFLYGQLFLQLVLATVLGGLIGLERERDNHPAGLRTYALVSLGSAAFTILSRFGFNDGDPSRIASQIVVGIGFLGAGIILHKANNVIGLTTAAGVWVAAAVGMAVGVGNYLFAFMIAIITFIVLSINDKKAVQAQLPQKKKKLN